MKRFLPALVLSGLAFSASGGVFHLSSSTLFPPFIVVHPASYDGVTGGPLEVKICVGPGSETTRPALESAVGLWNGMTPTTGNCSSCRLLEEGPAMVDKPHSMATVLLHELGHCALGLGHINWQSPDTQIGATSYTNTKDATMISVGADGIRGSFDDRPVPLPGSRLLHWFRIADNNPFVVTGVVDSSTYSRRIDDLPAGHQWPASGNNAVAQALGFADTQAVMYSHIDVGQSYSGLTADGIDTVRFAMSGVDETAGTSDDYTVSLKIVDDCAGANIEVVYQDFGEEDESLGACLSDLEPLPTPSVLKVHHVLKPFYTNPRALVEINLSIEFDVIHASGFESGGTLGWTP